MYTLMYVRIYVCNVGSINTTITRARCDRHNSCSARKMSSSHAAEFNFLLSMRVRLTPTTFEGDILVEFPDRVRLAVDLVCLRCSCSSLSSFNRPSISNSRQWISSSTIKDFIIFIVSIKITGFFVSQIY